MVGAINALIPELFYGVKGFEQTTLITNDDLKFEDSLKKNEKATRADAWSWLTVLLIVSFGFGAVLSSVAAWYLKKEEERK